MFDISLSHTYSLVISFVKLFAAVNYNNFRNHFVLDFYIFIFLVVFPKVLINIRHMNSQKNLLKETIHSMNTLKNNPETDIFKRLKNKNTININAHIIALSLLICSFWVSSHQTTVTTATAALVKHQIVPHSFSSVTCFNHFFNYPIIFHPFTSSIPPISTDLQENSTLAVSSRATALLFAWRVKVNRTNISLSFQSESLTSIR